MPGLFDKTQTLVEVQFGGPGNPYQVLGTVADNDVSVGAPSGGGQSFETFYARDVGAGAGQFASVGVRPTSNPEPWTFSIMKRLRSPFSEAGVNALRRKFSCLHNARIRQLCGDMTNKTNYDALLLYNQVNGTSYSYDGNVAEGQTIDGTPLMEQIDERAVDEIRLKKVSHVDIKGTVIDFDINDVISVGVFQCAGNCGPANDGDQDFWAVTDRDSTPGYLTVATPQFLYTRDGGLTWGVSSIAELQVADALSVAKVGGYIVVASATAVNGGIAYALYQDILDGVGAPWAKSTGITNNEEPRAVAAIGSIVWAAGVGGYIYRSTDGPFAFSAVSAGALTVQNFNAIAIADENLVYFGANAGVVAKYENGVLTQLTLTNSAGATVTSANIKTIAVPPGAARGNEVYIGTADGKIFRSKQKGAAGTWEAMSFDKSGTGTIDKIVFARPDGVVMFVVQSSAGGANSRVLRDLSGGALGQDVEPIGTFLNPSNLAINSIAASSPNVAISVGQIVNAQGFIGKVS